MIRGFFSTSFEQSKSMTVENIRKKYLESYFLVFEVQYKLHLLHKSKKQESRIDDAGFRQ